MRSLAGTVWWARGEVPDRNGRHGQKMPTRPKERGHADRVDRPGVRRFREAWSVLNIQYDDFIRTTEPRHYVTVQKFLSVIYENGYIYKDVYKGLYCVSCEDYYTLEASDEGRCPIHHSVLTEMEEELVLSLERLEERLIEFYDTHPGIRHARDESRMVVELDQALFEGAQAKEPVLFFIRSGE